MHSRRSFLKKAFASGTVLWSGLRLPTVAPGKKASTPPPARARRIDAAPAWAKDYPWTY
jgi:hypothetical protein